MEVVLFFLAARRVVRLHPCPHSTPAHASRTSDSRSSVLPSPLVARPVGHNRPTPRPRLRHACSWRLYASLRSQATACNSPPVKSPSLLATPPTVQPGSTPTRVQRNPLQMAYQSGPRDQMRDRDVSDKVYFDPRCHMLHRSGGPLKSKIKSTSSIPQGLKVCLIGSDTYSPGVASSCGTRFG